MPSSNTTTEPSYVIWFGGGTREGTARELLDGIRREGAVRSETIRNLTADQYASVIVSDAAFFLPRDLLAFLRTQTYETEFDRALRYLAEMRDSGVRILTKK